MYKSKKVNDADPGDYYITPDKSYMLFTGEKWIQCEDKNDLDIELDILGIEGCDVQG